MHPSRAYIAKRRDHRKPTLTTGGENEGAASPDRGKRRRGRPPLATGATSVPKASEFIPMRDADNFVAALRYAHSIGREPTQFITFQPRHAPSRTPFNKRRRRLINKLGTWLKDRTGEPAIYVQFREGGKHKGDHLHMLVWVPAAVSAAFIALFEKWVAADSADTPLGTALVIKPVEPGSTLTEKGLRSYGLKQGCDAVRAKYVSSRHQRAPRGKPVLGQRVKVSHSIGVKARGAAGWGGVAAGRGRRPPE